MSDTSRYQPIHRILLATEDNGLATKISGALSGEPFRIGLVASRGELRVAHTRRSATS